jgi:hypothetical protein
LLKGSSNGDAGGLVLASEDIVEEPFVSNVSDLVLGSIITRGDGSYVPIKLVEFAVSLQVVYTDTK